MASDFSDDESAAWFAQLFEPVFFDSERLLTVDPAERIIVRSDHPLVPVVALLGPDEGARVPPKGLLLAPVHLPRLLNDPVHGPPVLARVVEMAESIRAGLRAAYPPSASEPAGSELRHLIWLGMGGSVEDKYAALAVGLLREEHVQVWGLDDVNSDSLAHVLRSIAADERARALAAGHPLSALDALGSALRRTVVVAQALGMTSFEPAFNVRHCLAPLFARHGLAASAHLFKMTLPGSVLDLALPAPVVSLPHQPHGQSSAAGRHDFVTHGLLLPLALCGCPLGRYAASLRLGAPAVAFALRLASALDRAGLAGKEALVLRLPPSWRGRWHARPGSGCAEWRDPALWLQQSLEESLGKPSDSKRVLKLLAQPEAPTDPATQLVLLVRHGAAPALGGEDEAAALRQRGYEALSYELPSELPSLPGEGAGPEALGHLMAVFALTALRLAQLWGVCAVDQPPVECYKRIVACLEAAPAPATAAERGPGAVEPTDLAQAAAGGAGPSAVRLLVEALAAAAPAPGASRGLRSGGLVELELRPALLGGGVDGAALASELGSLGLDPASSADVLGAMHRLTLRRHRPRLSYGEAIYFGNLGRGGEARAMRELLSGAFARDVWADAARSFADVGKGPGVGHATHAMGKQGQVLTLSLLPLRPEASPEPAAAEAGAAEAELTPEQLGLALYPRGYQTSHAHANVLALAGFDVAAGPDGQPELQAHKGHPGAVVLLRIARNDQQTRDELARIFARVAEIVRM